MRRGYGDEGTITASAPEFMDLTDRMGFLVMDEAFDESTHGKIEHGYHRSFGGWADRDLADIARCDRNHPSVVLWSLGNESGEQHVEGGHLVLARLRETLRREDPTRPFTTGNDHMAADAGPTPGAFLDLVDYDYVDRWRDRRELYAEADRQRHPDWRMIGTENVAIRGGRGAYSLGDDPDRPRPDYMTRMIRAENLWEYVALHDYFAGDCMWTGIDYLGETRWLRLSFGPGLIDLVGYPTDAFFFYQSQWADAPVLHLFPHWNWPDCEAQMIPVLAYTNLDAVELYLNGRYLGEKRIQFLQPGTAGCWNCYEANRVAVTTDDLHLSWDVPYEPGVLRAVGKRGNEVVLTREVRTAGPPVALQLSVDRDTIRAGVRDVAHFRVEVVDAAGSIVPLADDRITVEVEGPAWLRAVGNGDSRDHGPYQAGDRRAHPGLALAFVQTTDETGSVRVTARADGLGSAAVDPVVVPGAPAPRLP